MRAGPAPCEGGSSTSCSHPRTPPDDAPRGDDSLTGEKHWAGRCPLLLPPPGESLLPQEVVHIHPVGHECVCVCVCVCVLSHFSRVQLFVTLWTVALQAPLSMGFSRQEYWSGLPCPPPGDLPDPGIELRPLAAAVLQADPLPLSH